MKKNLNKLLIAVCVIYTVVTLVNGCASPNPNAGQPIYNPQTGQPVMQTNSAGVLSPAVQPPYVPNKTIGDITSTGSAIAPFVPAPYGGLLTAVLGLTTVIAGGIAGWKNNQANGLTTQLTSVIQGVENATTDSTGANVVAVSGTAVKASIASHAKAAGVAPALAANVQKVTA